MTSGSPSAFSVDENVALGTVLTSSGTFQFTDSELGAGGDNVSGILYKTITECSTAA